MRITNRMMTNNMLSNINSNKSSLSKLEDQYSTGKKIQRPSDDPIITVRSLKLRTNITEVDQYVEKNIPDALSWMDITESALSNVNNLVSQMNTYCVQGSSDTLTATNRNSIVKNLEEMRDQIYQEGNANYAGRYVFTGYKTDSALLFDKKTTNLDYSITEKFSGSDMDIISKVSGCYAATDASDPDVDLEDAPLKSDMYRLRLAYGNLSTTAPEQISYTKKVGTESEEMTPLTNIVSISSTDPDAYYPTDDQIHYIPETGELIMGKSIYDELKNADSMSVTYGKSSFENGDLKPEHYFDCTVTDENYPEKDPVVFTKDNQEIQYEVNYYQRITVNTQASDVFRHAIGRDIDEILSAVTDVMETEEKIKSVENQLKDTSLLEEEQKRLNKLKEQLETELVLKTDIMQSSFSKGIGNTSNYQDQINVAVADLGSRYVRVELTESRLSDQKIDYEDLLSNNEDADLVDTVIKYSSAETLYNSSLSAASKVVQNSLLDFL